MIDLRVKGEATKNRLIEATESLIANKCFEAVSVRDITGLAKANVAAVNYHYGCREGLLGSVLDFRMKPLSAERAQRLEALGEQATVREIFQAWAQPLLSSMASRGLNEQAHARVLGRCLEVLAAGTFTEASAASRLLDASLQQVLSNRLPTLKAEEISWRLHFAQGALIHLLVHGATVQDDFRLAKALELWVEACVAQFDVDSLQDRRLNGEKAQPRPKTKSTAPMRQMAEVVSAVMEADEEEPPITVINGVEVEEEPAPAMAASKPARGKKAKSSDDTGELFLF
jgi:AcrR family transcriptional regulator